LNKAKIKKKLSKTAKKNIAKQIGKQIRKILEENIDSIDPKAADFTKKYAEYLALRAMGEKTLGKKSSAGRKYSSATNPEISSGKNKKFKIKIKGMNKVVKDVMKGKNAEGAIKANAGIFTSFTFKW